MLHFCFFSYEIFPFTRGGAGTYISSVSVRLIALGHKVTLVLDLDKETFLRCVSSTKNQATGSSQLELKLLSDIVPPDLAPRENFPSDAHWKSFQFSLAAESVHAQAPIDILEFVDYCGPSYYTLLKRAAKPHSLPKNIVIRMHNTIELIDKCASSDFTRSRVFDYWLERSAIALADRILSPGVRYWSDVASRLYNVPAERVVISPPCRSLLPRLNDGIGGKNILFVGRISTIKGMDLFLQAMAAICTDAALVSRFDQIRVVGPSESVATQDEEVILNYKQGIPPEKIQFLGNLNESDLIHELSQAQLAVFPNRCESFCYAAHEAHMIGVPLILSSIPAFLDHFVEGHTALFFNDTLHDLTARIRKLLLDTELRKQLSASVLQHRARYEEVIYGPGIDHADAASNQPMTLSPVAVVKQQLADLSENRPAITIVFFCRKSHQVDEHSHIEYLRSIGYKIDIIVLYVSDGHGTIHAFGQHWDFAELARSPSKPLCSGLVLLLSDSLTLAPSFIERGNEIMARMSAVGAILPVASKGRWGTAEFGPAADIFTLHVGEPTLGFPLLMRLVNQIPLQQLLHDRSPYTALTLLIELRAAGFVVVDDIHPTLTYYTNTPSFFPPRSLDTSAFVKRNLSRFRDYELATSLGDVVQAAPASVNTVTDSPGMTRRVLQDFHQGLEDTLYIHVVHGSVAVLSIVDPTAGHELNWHEVQKNGAHVIVEVKDRPLGILELQEGSCLRIDRGVRMVFNLGLSPTGGMLAMITNNHCALLSTHSESFHHCSFTPRDLFEIVATPRFELPNRAYHLAAYMSAQVSDRQMITHDPSLTPAVDCCLFFEDHQDCLASSIVFVCHHAVQLQRNGKSDAFLVDEIAANAHSLGVSQATFYGLGWIEIATRLLENSNVMRVKFIISTMAIWSATVALQLLKIGNLIERFRDRVSVVHPAALLGYFPEFKTVCTYSLSQPCGEFSMQAVDSNSSVQIIIDHNPVNEFYMGHMAAVSKILYANDILIDEISVPTQQQGQDRLFEGFGLNHLVRYYKKIDVRTALPGKNIVYLNPFPFGENIGNIKNALHLGWHTVISPYESGFLKDVKGGHFHVVTYWEDVDLITDILLRSIRGMSASGLKCDLQDIVIS